MNRKENSSGKRKSRAVSAWWSVTGAVTGIIASVVPAFAATANVWDKLSTMLMDVYGKILGISTVAAVTVAAVALIIRMVSRNQRAVDEATQWLKRVVITWLILNSLGFIVTYIKPLVAGGNYAISMLPGI